MIRTRLAPFSLIAALLAQSTAFAQKPPASSAGSAQPASPPAAAPAAPAAPPSVPATPPAASPDIVRTRDGGMVRGTISELKPKDYVIITLPNGQERKFSMSEVEYAGPADAAPRPKGEAKSESRGEERPERPRRRVERDDRDSGGEITLTATEPDVTYYVKTVEGGGAVPGGYLYFAGYNRLCTAPCRASLPSGSYELALSKGGKLAEASDPITVQSGTTLRGTYVDRTGMRVAGWLIAAGGTALGTWLMLSASQISTDASCRIDCDSFDSGKFYGGVVLMSASLAIGVVMATRRNKAEISVSPGVASLSVPALAGWSPSEAKRPGSGLGGLSLVGRFLGGQQGTAGGGPPPPLPPGSDERPFWQEGPQAGSGPPLPPGGALVVSSRHGRGGPLTVANRRAP